MQYLVYKGDKQWGPYSAESILEYLASGQFDRTDLCWFEGQADWVPLGSIHQFQKPAPPPPPSIQAPPPPRIAPPPPTTVAALPTVTLDPNQLVKAVKDQNAGIRIAPYIFGLLCFFMPFMEVSCNGHTMMTLSGIQMATGTQVHMNDPITGQDHVQDISGDAFAVIAVVCVIAALALSFSPNRSQSIGSVIVSGLAILALIILKARSEQSLAEHSQGSPIPIIMNFLYGFWLVAVSAGIGLILSILRIQKR